MSLQLDTRMYRYVRANAMPNTLTAAVELLHNCLDAFKSSVAGDVTIEYDIPNKTLKISDNGPGVAPDRMIDCFGTVGKYTASSGSRGFFSRGASDCSALGNVTFVSHHLEGSTCLELNYDTSYKLETIEATGDTGMIVSIAIDKYSALSSYDDMRQLGQYFSLRNFLKYASSCSLKIGTEMVDILQDNKDFLDNADKDEMIDNLTLNLKSGKTATLRLFKVHDPEVIISDSISQRHGIMMNSKYATHALSTIHANILAHQMVSHVRGELQMDFIEDEMIAFENHEVDVPIIDHSRLNGLNQHHVEVQELYSLLYKLLMYHLDQLWKQKEADLDVSDLELDNIFEGEPDLLSLMQNAVNTSSSEKIYSDVMKIQNQLATTTEASGTGDGGEPVVPATSVLNEDPTSAPTLQNVQSMNLVIRVVNSEEHSHERSCPHTWAVSNGNLIITIDGGCHCLCECVTQDERLNVMSIIGTDVIINFVQNKSLSSISATSSSDLLVKLHMLQTKYFEPVSMLIHNKLKKIYLL